jgi:lysophospholipase L1-like esterase
MSYDPANVRERKARSAEVRAQGWLSERRNQLIVAGLILILAVWALWPSRYSRVAGLDSRGTNIIAFGDSLTAGAGASSGEDYPSRLSSLIGATIVNAGVNGDTTDAALARIDNDVLSRDPRIVIVGLGGNDYLRGVPLSTTEENLHAIIRKIHDGHSMVVLLGFRFPSLSVNYGKMYDRVASDERCLLVPDLLDGIEGNASLKSDEIHPNGRGYQLMAERMSGPIGKLIKKADAAR